MNDHERHIAGLGRFVADLLPQDTCVMAVLRAPVAHGQIVSLDVSAARDLPGVIDVLEFDDLEGESVGVLRTGATVEGMKEPERHVLAKNKVVYQGQPVAAVLAKTQALAEDALELIELEISDLKPVFDLASIENSEAIWPDISQNSAFRWEKGNKAEVKAVFKRAEHVIEQDVMHPRVSVAPIETRSCTANFSDGAYTLQTGSQGVVSVRREVAVCLGIEIEQLRVITPDVGGSFAVKIWAYPEHILALVFARRTGRTVHWTSTRGESLLSDTVGRGRLDKGSIAFNADGKILGFRIDAVADMGAFLNSVGPYVATGGAVRPYGQCYDIPAMHYSVNAVFTNAAPTDAYRGAGKPESASTLERLIDLAAASLGLDPLEMRLRNLVSPDQLPYETPMGETYDSGDFPAIAERLKEISDWSDFEKRQNNSLRAGFRRGRAACFHLHATGGSTAERTYIHAEPDGTLVVRSGTQDSGQGHRDALGKIAAEAFEVPMSQIRVEQGDSDKLETGGGTGGSCLLPIAGNNLHLTAQKMIEENLRVASELLESAATDVEYGKGGYRVVGTDKFVSWSELAEKEQTNCATSLDFEGIHTTFPNAGYAVEVELDADTGIVRIDRFIGVNDVGRIINLDGVLGQLHGGIAQGIGEAMSEALISSEDGQLLTGSLMDYTLPRADMIPELQMEFLSTGSPNSELGAKGMAELPSIGTPGVVMNAIIDAAGVKHLDKPVTPMKIWTALSGS